MIIKTSKYICDRCGNQAPEGTVLKGDASKYPMGWSKVTFSDQKGDLLKHLEANHIDLCYYCRNKTYRFATTPDTYMKGDVVPVVDGHRFVQKDWDAYDAQSKRHVDCVCGRKIPC